MRLEDKNSGDLEQAKLSLLSRWRNYEKHLIADLHDLANSGFADARLCAMARSDLEKAFLEIEKALRLGAPNEYAKAPTPPGDTAFRPRVDPTPEINSNTGQIEWKDHLAGSKSS